MGAISAMLYRPWRRRVDARRNALRRDVPGVVGEEDVLQEFELEIFDGVQHGELEILEEEMPEHMPSRDAKNGHAV